MDYIRDRKSNISFSLQNIQENWRSLRKKCCFTIKIARINLQAAWAFEIVAQRRIGSNYVILGNGQKPVNRQEQPSLRRPILQFGKVTTGSWA